MQGHDKGLHGAQVGVGNDEYRNRLTTEGLAGQDAFVPANDLVGAIDGVAG